MSSDKSFEPFGRPSKTLTSNADVLVSSLDHPILDVACGYGRNAVALAVRGASVVCVDCDLERLRTMRFAVEKHFGSMAQVGNCSGSIHPVCAKVNETAWPFAAANFSAIICVHFLNLDLLGRFAEALVPGGYLYVETFDNRGGNYLDLPRAGELRCRLSEYFSVHYYDERKAGPPEWDAVTAKVLSTRT